MVSTRGGTSYKPKLGSYGRKGRAKKGRTRRGSTPEQTARLTRSARLTENFSTASTPEDLGAIVDTPPSHAGPSRRSEGGPTCSHYGKVRRALYRGQGYFFCHPCDLWDAERKISPRIKRSSRRFKCEANHKSFLWPTDKMTIAPSPEAGTREKNPKKRKLNFSNTEDIETSKLNPSEDAKQEADDEDTPFFTPQGAESQSTVVAQNIQGTPGLTPEGSKLVKIDQLLRHLQFKVAAADPGYETSPLAQEVAQLKACLKEEAANKKELESAVRKAKLKFQQANRQVRYLTEKLRRLSAIASPKNSEDTDSEEETVNGEAGSISHFKSENERFQFHMKRALELAIQSDPLFSKWGAPRLSRHLVKVVVLFRGGICEKSIAEQGRVWLRDNVYNPYAILREMDLAGGTLSYEGLEILRRVETKGKKGVRCALPSTAELKRAAANVERVGDVKCPYTVSITEFGEMIKFHLKKTLHTVMEAYSLLRVGREKSLDVAESLDGTNLSKHLSHILAGLKVIDRCARCPITGDLFLQDPDKLNAQSRQVCIPLMILMGRENKETFKLFEPMFKFLAECSHEETNHMADLGLKPINLVANCDMSAQWKALCKGGAHKKNNLPCHCCSTPGDIWHEPNANHCNRWCRELYSDRGSEWKCYHHSMSTEENLDSMGDDLQVLTNALSQTLEDIEKSSKMEREDAHTAVGNALVNPRSIHFVPESDQQTETYLQLVTDELMLRELSPLGNWLQRRERLRTALDSENKIRELTRKLSHCKEHEGALFLLIQAVPCILHMENRIGIKILTMLLVHGLSNAKKGLLHGGSTLLQRIDNYFAEIALILNMQVFGTEENPSQWDCPRDPKGKDVGTITMDNVRTRKAMNSLELLVDKSVVDDEKKELWQRCIAKYRSAMEKLRTKEDMEPEDIISFQKDADDFFQIWVSLFGLSGCTNYIHMLGSGHVSTYLFRWKNLYRHSQQGWESLNAMVKTFWFRRSSRGGATNKGKGNQSRLKPIARWLQRRLVWLCGYDKESILLFLAEHENNISGAMNNDEDDDVHGDIAE